jgi:hypothetical protein
LIQKSVFKFVWNCKNDKVARKTSTKNVADGGIGIPNVKNYIHALKLMWIRKLVHSKHKWTEIIKLVNKKILCIEKIGILCSYAKFKKKRSLFVKWLLISYVC